VSCAARSSGLICSSRASIASISGPTFSMNPSYAFWRSALNACRASRRGGFARRSSAATGDAPLD
jgi:hypothetical protein